jgi:hypothetical protein
MKKTSFLLFIFFISFTANSQQKTKIISGKIIDSLGIVVNANIINLKTSQGTFSNDEGVFRIFANIGDTLSISSVQHIKKKIRIDESIYNNKETIFYLNINVEKLEEFELKRHDLKGSLGIDIKEVPRDKIDSLVSRALDFSNINFAQEDRTIDAIEKVRPEVVNTMQGAMPMAGSGFKASLPSKRFKEIRELRKELEHKKAFPYKLLNELGEKFFFDELKIPIDKYFHFLEYCNPLGIENLYKEGKILDIINILRSESTNYQKIIEKND